MVKDETIPEALKKLSDKTDIELAFSERFFDKKRKISLDGGDRSIEEILNILLENTGVEYKEIDGQIVLFRSTKITPKQFTLSGYVEDATSGERLIAAAVYCPELSLGTVTNEYGFYSLTLPENMDEVTISYLGYQEEKQAISLSKNQFIVYQLKPSVTLSEIIVTPSQNGQQLLPSPTDGTRFLAKEYHAAPALGGESDLMRVAQLLPGVQTGADGFGGLHIRGGNADQNLVLLDGVPVYNPDHLFSIFSVFNTSAVKSAKLLRGSFPARYGGRVSSVFDVRVREGNNKNWSGGAAFDLISGKGFLEGPFAKGKASFLITGRATHSDFLLDELSKKAFFGLDNANTDYDFFDLNAKMSYRFSEKDRVYLSYYQGNDFFIGNFEESFEDESIDIEESYEVELDWGNTISSLRWNHVFSPKLFSNTTLTYSKYQFNSIQLFTSSPEAEEEEEDRESFFYEEARSNIEDQALRIDFDFSPNTKHYFRFGGTYAHHRFVPESGSYNEGSLLEFDEIDSLDFSDFENNEFSFIVHTNELTAYLEDEFRIGKKWYFNVGLRLSAFFSDENYFNVEPRLIGRFHLTERASINASLTRNVQYLHRVLLNEINLPQDVWIPANESQEPQQSWQTTLGIETAITNGITFSLEGYFKDMKNLQAAIPDISYLPEEDEFLVGTGQAYGAELFLRKTTGKTGGWFSYTLSKAEREFSDNLGTRRFISRFDRRHDLKIFIYQKLDHWQVSLNWLYGSPMPQLLAPDENFDPSIPSYSLRQVIRSEPYHRLDAALTYYLVKKKSEHTFKLSIYNAYNRENPAFYRPSIGDSGSVKLVPVNLLSALPGIYYGVKF